MNSKALGANCGNCPLAKQPYVPSKLIKSSKVAFIGEGPGSQEVINGEPFVGQSGLLLHHVAKRFTKEEFSKLNIVCCRPPNNRTPTEEEVECCSGRLTNELIDLNPEVVVAMGKTAANFFSGSSMKVSERRGLWFDFGNGLDVLCTWHPAYVLRRPGEMNAFVKDIQKAFEGRQGAEIPQILMQMPTNTFQLKELLDTIEGPNVVFDLETDQLQWYESEDHPPNHILMLGIADSENRAIIVNHDLLYGSGGDEGYFNRDNDYFEGQRNYMAACSALHSREVLQDFFNREDLTFIAHNGKFDVLFLKTLGIHARTDFDTMLAHYVLFEDSLHGLKRLVKDYFGIGDYEGELVQTYLKSRNDYYSKVPMPQLAKYCAIDVSLTFSLAKVLHEELCRDDLLEDPFLSVIMKFQTAFTEVEFRGVGVDVPYVKDWQEKIGKYLETLESQMSTVLYEKLADILEHDEHRFTQLQKDASHTVKTVMALLMGEKPFNPRSSYMMSFAMYNVFKIPRPRARNIKPTSTSKEAIINILEKYPELEDNPWIMALKKYRRAHKMQRSYIKNILDNVDINGSVHPTFLVHGTEVGRLSARNPAVQTIPRPHQDVFGAIIRSAFVARPGKLFIDADYSQAELRVAACLSEDPFLLQVYKEDRDLHTEVAVEMYGEDFTYEDRMLTKMFNFSYLYGGNEWSFAQDAGLPIEVAKKFVNDYNSVMSRLAEWKIEQLILARSQGYVESFFGRRRRFPLITRENLDDVRKACVHMPIASVASDLTVLTMCKLIEEGYSPVLTVHDSVIVETDVLDAIEDAQHIKEIMEQVASEFFPQVPWKVDADIVTRWSPYPIQVNATGFAKDYFGDLPKVLDMTEMTGVKELDKLLVEHGKLQLWPQEIA